MNDNVSVSINRIIKRKLSREIKYFDSNLAKNISYFYPEFLKNKVPEDFKNKILLDSIEGCEFRDDASYMMKKELDHMAIEYKFVAGYFIIAQEDWNFIKLSGNKHFDTLTSYRGLEIGQLLLNEINDFIK